MALTISITKHGKPTDFNEEKSVTFEGNTSYWEFIEPWIRDFNKKCSESIDLYSFYNLNPKNLPALLEVLLQARELTLKGPSSLSINCGTVTHAGRSEEITQIAVRDELVTFIDKMIYIAKEAIELKETLAILGD